MKMRNNRLRSLRRSRVFALAAVAALTSVGCEKVPSGSETSGSAVRFDVSVADGWYQAPESRTAAAGETCDGEEVIGVYQLRDEQGNGQSLYLVATVSDWKVDPDDLPSTRAALIGPSNFYDTFGVLAYAYEGSWNVATCTPNLMYDTRVSSSALITDKVWPGTGYVRFYAYAPVDKHAASEGSINNYLALSSQSTPGVPTISYIASSSDLYNEDLLYAVSTDLPGDGSAGSVQLAFNHALTSVNLVSGGDLADADGQHFYHAPKGTMSMYRISGLGMQGTFSFDGTWSNVGGLSSEGDNYIEMVANYKQINGVEGESLLRDETAYAMVIPQTLPAGALLEFVYTDADTNVSRTLKADISGLEFQPGKTVTFHISASEITVLASTSFSGSIWYNMPDGMMNSLNGTSVSFDYQGVETSSSYRNSFVVFSLSSNARCAWWDAFQDAVVSDEWVSYPWTITPVEDDGAGGYREVPMPAWLHGVQTSGYGLGRLDVTVDPQTLLTDADGNQYCEARSVKLLFEQNNMETIDPGNYQPIVFVVTQEGYNSATTPLP